jgi:putative acetyltransferase
MFEEYSKDKSAYFVVECNGKGVRRVLHLWRTRQQVFANYKMYFLPETRGLGIGSAMMTKCLETAKDFGFKQCYLETMPFMLDAQKLYRKVGFENINAPMGSTGHTSCPYGC